MENQDYKIETVYLVGGSMEQTEEMKIMNIHPSDHRRREVETYENMLEYSLENISVADSVRKSIAEDPNVMFADGLDKYNKLAVVEEREKNAKINLALSNAALNFFKSEGVAQGFGGLQILLKNGNMVHISSGHYDNARDRVVQYSRDRKSALPVNIEQVLAELAQIDVAVAAHTYTTKYGRSSERKSDIQYLQPDRMKDVKVETKTEDIQK